MMSALFCVILMAVSRAVLLFNFIYIALRKVKMFENPRGTPFPSCKYVAHLQKGMSKSGAKMINAKLPSYSHALFYGMKMWHLPPLPHIYSSVFKNFRHSLKGTKLCKSIFSSTY